MPPVFIAFTYWNPKQRHVLRVKMEVSFASFAWWHSTDPCLTKTFALFLRFIASCMFHALCICCMFGYSSSRALNWFCFCAHCAVLSRGTQCIIRPLFFRCTVGVDQKLRGGSRACLTSSQRISRPNHVWNGGEDQQNKGWTATAERGTKEENGRRSQVRNNSLNAILLKTNDWFND